MDVVSSSVRSRMMASVPQKNTEPELIIHSLGFRFRLHHRDLPGTPDIVLPRFKKVIFVHGCYGHRHGCRKTTTPASNVDFWLAKFGANQRRDRQAIRSLRREGWISLIVWECQTKRMPWLSRKLEFFLAEPDVVGDPKGDSGTNNASNDFRC